jgi:hypothetical protein
MENDKYLRMKKGIETADHYFFLPEVMDEFEKEVKKRGDVIVERPYWRKND